MCDLRLRATPAKEALKLLLDAWGRVLLRAHLLFCRGVPPPADEEPTVGTLAPVAVTAVGVGRPFEDAARHGCGREHLAPDRSNAQRHEMLRVGVDADHDCSRPDTRAVRSDLALRCRDRARALVDAGARLQGGPREPTYVPHRV